MSALILYLATTIALYLVWRRFVQPITAPVAIALILLPFVFTGKAMLSGQIYGPIDLPYMAEPLSDYKADFGIERIHNGTLSDLYAQIIPWRQAVRDAYAAGEWPLWNPYLLCGSILAPNGQSAPYDPFVLLTLLIDLPSSLTYTAAITFFLAGFFAWAFARALGIGPIAALVAAAGFMYSSKLAFFVAWPLARSWALLPLVLFGVWLVVREANLRAAIVLALGFVLLILSGHPETVLHVVAFGAVYGLFELVRAERKLRALGLAVGAGVVSLLLTAVYLLPFANAAPETVEHWSRERFASAHFFDVPDVVARRAAATFLPFYAGRPWQGNTFTKSWDPQTARVGGIVFALAAAALLLARRRREMWFFAIAGTICLFAAFDAWPVAHLLHELPLFDIALNNRLAFAAAFCFALLAAMAVDSWSNRGLIPALVVTAALMIATSMVWGSQIRLGVEPELMRKLVAAELIPLLLVFLVLATTRIPRRVALPLVVGLLLVQRTIQDGSIYPTISRDAFYPRVRLLETIANDARTPFRITGKDYTLIPDTAALYGLEDARGYEAMTFSRLHDTYPLWSLAQPVSFNLVSDLSRPFLSFLNVRYAIAPAGNTPPPGWRLVAAERNSLLFENTRVLPRAFVPKRVRYRPKSDAILREMQEATDFADTAWILANHYRAHEMPNGPGTVTIRRVGSTYEIDAKMQNEGWVVVSESAWKGWRAYVDGHRLSPLYANHAFLGVFVPTGEHKVRLVYLPHSFTLGRDITFATIALLIAVSIAAAIRRKRQMSR